MVAASTAVVEAATMMTVLVTMVAAGTVKMMVTRAESGKVMARGDGYKRNGAVAAWTVER